MKSLILVVLCGLCAPAFGAVTYQGAQSIYGVIPVASGSLTPHASGDALVVVANDQTRINATMTVTGTGTYTEQATVGPYNFGGSTFDVFANLSSTASAQTATVATPTSDTAAGFVVDYSGVVSVKNGVYATSSAPGTGTGAIAGTAVTVASGDKLLVWIVDVTNTPTITSPSGTLRAANGPYYLFEFAGAGSAITPTFTTNNGTDNYVMQEFVLSATSAGGSCTHSFWSSSGAFAVPNGTTGNYWNAGTGNFSTPNCSTGSYYLSTGGVGAN